MENSWDKKKIESVMKRNKIDKICRLWILESATAVSYTKTNIKYAF